MVAVSGKIHSAPEKPKEFKNPVEYPGCRLSNLPVDQPVKVKKECSPSADTDNFFSHPVNPFLPAYLFVREIDSKQSAINHPMEFWVVKSGDASIRLGKKMLQPPEHLFVVFVIETEIQILLDTILFLIDKIVQKNMKTLHPWEVGIFYERSRFIRMSIVE